MSNMAVQDTSDWMDDESLSFDEAHARFEALHPEPTSPARPSLPSAARLVVVPSSCLPVVTTSLTSRATGMRVISRPALV